MASNIESFQFGDMQATGVCVDGDHYVLGPVIHNVDVPRHSPVVFASWHKIVENLEIQNRSSLGMWD